MYPVKQPVHDRTRINECEYDVSHYEIRSAVQVLAKRKLKYYRFSECVIDT